MGDLKILKFMKALIEINEPYRLDKSKLLDLFKGGGIRP